MSNLLNFEGLLQTSIPIDAIMLRLLGATIVFVHETIRTMNMYH